MKTLSKKAILILTFFVLLFGFSSCNDEFLEPKAPKSILGSENLKISGDITSIQFDPALFATKIENRLDGQVPGYAYCIIKNGQVVAQKGKGDARYSVDSPARLYSGNEIQDIASTTKYVTALLTMKLLDRTGLPIDLSLERRVSNYLPKFFSPSIDFRKVTFRDLLAHTSGIINYGSSFSDIQKTAENGINETTDVNPLPSPKPFGQYDYQNINYIMLRYAVVYLAATQNPAIAYSLIESKNPGPNEKAILNLTISNWFRKLIREEICQPALIADWNSVDFKAWGISDNQNVKYYNSVNSNVAGYDSGDHLIDAAGAGGLKLSARQLAQIVGAARAGLIMKTSLLNKMKLGDGFGNQIGFDDAYSRSHGKYYHKNGSGAGNAVLLDFDGTGVNVQLAITTNKKSTDVANTKVWADLFDQSWK